MNTLNVDVLLMVALALLFLLRDYIGSKQVNVPPNASTGNCPCFRLIMLRAHHAHRRGDYG
jgi:hypothetical protein